jgi:hypothetical protein
MINLGKYFFYGIFSLLNILVIIYYFLNLHHWPLFGYDLSTCVLLASTAYLIFMEFHYITNTRRHSPLSSNEIGHAADRDDKMFMTDVFSKYVFALEFIILIVFIVQCFTLHFDLYPLYPSDLFFAVFLYVNFVLPIVHIFELFITHRRRSHSFLAELIILFAIVFVHCLYNFLVRALVYEYAHHILPVIGQYILMYFISIVGYTFFDYVQFKQSSSATNYALIHVV